MIGARVRARSFDGWGNGTSGRADVSIGLREGKIELVANEDSKGRTPVPRKSAVREDVAGTNVGNALRTVYDQAVNEDIPGEMLDLLGKLA